jgi:RNA polymerase sigma factor (TIGR02999 family)
MEDTREGPITTLLQMISKGDQEAFNKLLPLVYSELRRLASRYLAGEYQKRTIQTTELVHEAYLKLIGQNKLSLENRRHFFGAAANAMREILVENARKRNALKRGRDNHKVTLERAGKISIDSDQDFLVLNEALTRLDAFDNRLYKIVELRFFTGLTIEETSELLSISVATVKRDWSIARAWLYREMERNN